MNTKYKLIIFSLVCIPILYLIYMVTRYTVDILSFDEWYMVPLFEKMYSNSLTLIDLHSQFQEHRIIFPKVIFLILGRLTSWNLKYEVVFSVILSMGSFSTILYLLKKEQKYFRKYSVYLILPSLSFIIFSLNQFEWLWGFQMCIFLAAVSVVIGFTLLSISPPSWKSILSAIIFGFIATYSFASGLFFWPIALIQIYTHQKTPKKLKSRLLILWTLVSIFVFLSYFYGYSKPSYNPPISITLAFHQPIQYIKYFLILMGSPLDIVHKNWAILFGMLGLTTYAYLLIKLFKTKLLYSRLILFTIASGFYVITNSLITAAARLGFASQPAARYVTITELFWVSIIILLYLSLNLNKRVSLKASIFKIFSISLITILSIYSSIQGSQIAIRKYVFLSYARNNLLSNISQTDKLQYWGLIYPRHNVLDLEQVTNITQLNKDIYTLDKYGLSIFRN